MAGERVEIENKNCGNTITSPASTRILDNEERKQHPGGLLLQKILFQLTVESVQENNLYINRQ